MNEDTVNVRALFIGGPFDGQERVLPVETVTVQVGDVVYQRLSILDASQVCVYSVEAGEATLLRLWNCYSGGKYA